MILSFSLFLGIRKSIYLLRIAPLEELGVLPSTAERLSRPGSGPGCFERLLIAAFVMCGNDTPCNGEIEISREIGGK